MRLKNIFKKPNKKELKHNIQTLDKKQLEKVIGGAETGTVKGSMPIGGGVSGTTG